MRAIVLPILLFAAGACGARQEHPNSDQPHADSLAIADAWAAPTPSGVDVSAGYLSINNETAREDRLLNATSPRAARVEIHRISMDGTVMRMRPIPSLSIPAGQTIALAPGGAHLMFYGVDQPFTEGEEIPVQLTFEGAGVMNAVLPVRRGPPESHSAH